MATKPMIKKPAIKKASIRGLITKRPASIKARVTALEKRIAELDPTTKPRNPTAATLKALRQLRTGKLTRYVDEDDMFRKLGIRPEKGGRYRAHRNREAGRACYQLVV